MTQVSSDFLDASQGLGKLVGSVRSIVIPAQKARRPTPKVIQPAEERIFYCFGSFLLQALCKPIFLARPLT